MFSYEDAFSTSVRNLNIVYLGWLLLHLTNQTYFFLFILYSYQHLRFSFLQEPKKDTLLSSIPSFPLVLVVELTIRDWRLLNASSLAGTRTRTSTCRDRPVLQSGGRRLSPHVFVFFIRSLLILNDHIVPIIH